MATLTATEFKAKCLAVLDEVKATGESVTITKRGKPVAQITPLAVADQEYPQHRLRGTMKIVGDIISPAVPPEDWDANRGELF